MSILRAHAVERAEVEELREREMRAKGLSDAEIKKKLQRTRKRGVKVSAGYVWDTFFSYALLCILLQHVRPRRK